MTIKFEKQYRLKQAAEALGVSTATLRMYVNTGKIACIRTLGGHRRIPESELFRLLNMPPKISDKVAIYARVSSPKQQQAGNLERQVERLKTFAHEQNLKLVTVLTDVASGLNEQRKGLNCLLSLAREGKFSHILIEFRDRLTRFGYKYIEAYLTLTGVEILVKEETGTLPTTKSVLSKELNEDLITIINSFSGKLYGSKSARFRKLRRCVKATVSPDV